MSILESGNVRFIPSAHQRCAFAASVRQSFKQYSPDCVAVELPFPLRDWIIRGIMRLPQISAVCHPSPSNPGQMLYLPIDPCDSLIEAVRLAMEHEIEIVWLDDDPATEQPAAYPLPDDLMIERIGLERYIGTILPHLPPSSSAEDARERRMATKLSDAASRHERVLCVLGLGHFVNVRRLIEASVGPADQPIAPTRRTEGAFLSHVEKNSIPEFLREIPHVAYQWEQSRAPEDRAETPRFEKLTALQRTLKRAERDYRDRYKSQVNLTQMKALFQFTRNLALLHDSFQPDAYELVIGARGAVDGDYGYEVHETARSYPFQEDESSLPILTLKGGRGTFSDREEKFLMKSAFGDLETDKIKLRFRRRPSPEMKKIWKEQWDHAFRRGMCSWPPEDERQEKFMMFLRNRALQVLGEDKKQVLEFSTSILDGLDIRETMRNWHSHKIFVQQTPQPQGRVGAVVLLFEDESHAARYSWRCTLYAENQNESDISFFATPPGDDVVGPRICRTEFGGILSIFPATRIPDVWSYPGAAQLEKCSDVLLAGAVLFSEDRFIAYVASKPPSSLMREIASRFKKHIIYLPIQGFSAHQLKKVRRFHLLDGRDVRAYAADYIFDE